MYPRTPILPVLGLALIIGACSAPAIGAPPPTRDVAAPDPVMVADWSGTFELELSNGWTLTDCEGDAPMLCVVDGDRHVGFVELGQHPLPPDHDGGPQILAAHVADFLAGMQADRAVGCPELRFEATQATDVVVGGEPGVRAGFRLVDPDGTEVERHLLYWTVVEDAMVAVTAPAYAEGGCMESIGEFSPADLEQVSDDLDRVVADTPLPPPGGHPQQSAVLPDGSYVGRLVGKDAPVAVVTIDLVELLSGREAVAAARADGQLGPRDELPNDLYVRDLETLTWDVRVAAETVAVYDCTRHCGQVTVDTPDFLTGARQAMNREHALFELVIADGAVSEIAEIYLP